jgi:glycosyltransferase involved in cell wall biosynthesis
MFQAKVSICIPTYKQPAFLKRLLDSIVIQTHKNIEVIVSDDTPNTSVNEVVNDFKDLLDIYYHHHNPALKTPINWNFALDQANGEFIMLIHQDDWLAQNNSIEKYLSKFSENPNADFVFSKNTPINPDGSIVNINTKYNTIKHLNDQYHSLIYSYVIGPPSNIMVRRTVTTRYDTRLIWLVDVDYCVRSIKAGYRVDYIDEPLLNIGMHQEQATVFCYENPHIILRENILYANKLSKEHFKKIKLYDYFWRLLRNHKVRSVEDIILTGVDAKEINSTIKHMISLEKKIPLNWLMNGFISKTFMFLNYIIFRLC